MNPILYRTTIESIISFQFHIKIRRLALLTVHLPCSALVCQRVNIDSTKASHNILAVYPK